MDEIINKVAQSSLQVFDLEDYYPKQNKIGIDIAQWLYEGVILKEKEFREALKNHNWNQYTNTIVSLYCSSDAILPAWATILISSYLSPYTSFIYLGKLEDIDAKYYRDILSKIDYEVYKDKPVILKGCSKKPVPEEAYLLAITYLQKEVKSIMYGEACSAVPIFKKNKV